MSRTGHQATSTHLQDTLIFCRRKRRRSPGTFALGFGLFGGPVCVKIVFKFLPLALAKIDSVGMWPYTNW